MPVGTFCKVNWDAIERKAIYFRSCGDLSVKKGGKKYPEGENFWSRDLVSHQVIVFQPIRGHFGQNSNKNRK